MRGGLWSSFSVPAAGMFTSFDPYCDAGHRPVGTDRRGGRGIDAAAIEAGLELLIRRQTGNIHDGIGPIRAIGAISTSARHRASHQAAVVSPVEAQPRPPFPRLVLQMGGGVEILVVIDSKYSVTALTGRRGADSADLRFKKAGCDARKHHERRQPVKIRHAGAHRVAGDLGTRPLDRET